MRRASRFHDRQRIHIGAQAHATCAVTRLEPADHAVPADVARDFEGAWADAATITRIGECAAAAADPTGQQGMSAAYRRDLINALTTRALMRACGLAE